MPTFTIGEEVLHDGVRYVLAGIEKDKPRPYRLLATTRTGTRFVWAGKDQLKKIESYTAASNI